MKRWAWLSILWGVTTFGFGAYGDDSMVVHNSEFQVPGQAPSSIRWLRVVTLKKGRNETQDEVIAWSADRPLPKVNLTQGDGDYEVRLYSSTAPSSGENSYIFVGSFTVSNSDKESRSYLLPSLEIQSMAVEIVNVAQKVTGAMKTTLAKSLALHDWVTANVSYDEEGYLHKNFQEQSQDALSVLKSKLTVCIGYANLTAALHRAIGLRAKVVVGKLIGQEQDHMTVNEICRSPLGDHAWNEVLVDGQWITIDTTLDAGMRNGDTGQFVRTPNEHRYFNTNPQLLALTHVKCRELLQ